MNLFRLQGDIPSLNSETIFTIGGFPINNSSLMLFLIIAVLLVVAIVLAIKLSLKPGKFQSFLELVYESILGLVRQITGSEDRTHLIVPLIGALFIYIGMSNYFGLIPGLGSIVVDGKAIFRTPTSDFNTTFSLALAMVILLQYVYIREWGFFSYFGKFFQFKQLFEAFRKGIKEGLMAIIYFAIGLLDIVSELAKIVSLSLRLFGNMYAGEVLMTIILGAFAYVVPAIWLSMSMLSAIVQTLVFSLLVTAYYSLSVNPDRKLKKGVVK